MKYILGMAILFSAFTINAGERVFHLGDLEEKLNGGMTADQYCSEKANISVAQAKASNAPIEAQNQIKQWITIACSIDVINEGQRVGTGK